MAEDALAEIAGEEQPVGPVARERREESQLGDAEVLRLVDHRVGERSLLGFGQVGSKRVKQVRPG